MPVADPVLCISRIASKINITEKTKRHASIILHQAYEKKESAGKDPYGVGSSCSIFGMFTKQ